MPRHQRRSQEARSTPGIDPIHATWPGALRWENSWRLLWREGNGLARGTEGAAAASRRPVRVCRRCRGRGARAPGLAGQLLGRSWPCKCHQCRFCTEFVQTPPGPSLAKQQRICRARAHHLCRRRGSEWRGTCGVVRYVHRPDLEGALHAGHARAAHAPIACARRCPYSASSRWDAPDSLWERAAAARAVSLRPGADRSSVRHC